MYCYCYMVAVIVDMIGMFHIILLWSYPYVIPTIPVVIIIEFLFIVTRCTRCYRVDLWLCVGCANNLFSLYRSNTSKNISQKQKLVHL